MVIVEGKGAVLGVNLGRPIVTTGTLSRSCAEVCAAIELSFGVVSEVTPGIHVLHGVHVPQKEHQKGHLRPIGLNGQNDVFFAHKCI